jgi:hypothetical protein
MRNFSGEISLRRKGAAEPSLPLAIKSDDV